MKDLRNAQYNEFLAYVERKILNGLTATVSHVMPLDSISPYPVTGYIEGSEDMPLTWAANGQNFIS